VVRKKNSAERYQAASGSLNQQMTLIDPNADEHLSISTLETWLWDAACAIRGSTDAPKYKDFILPLIFYKRLSDVFDDECNKYSQEDYGDEELARQFIEDDHLLALEEGRDPIVRFFIPGKYHWSKLRNHSKDKLGEFVSEAMRAVAIENPVLKGVIDVRDYNERQSGQRTLDDDPLYKLIEIISRHRLGLNNAEPDILGRAYEYLIRKFAEGQGQSAGEFYTPQEVGELIAELLDPQPRTRIYDPACGSGGLMIKVRHLFEQRHPEDRSRAPHLYGQELNPTTYAMALMNMFLHDYMEAKIAIGDTMRNPVFASKGTGLETFNYVVANPMWNQKNYDETFYDSDPWKRFGDKVPMPPSNTADWGWVQLIHASLNEEGHAAIVLDTGAVSRGSGSQNSDRERDIRKHFVENDLIDCVVLLPENLFYNTTAPGIVLLLNNAKPVERKNQILLINASRYFVKRKPKNELTSEGIAAAAEVYHNWETREKLSRVITLEEARETDYNLSPSQLVDINDVTVHRSLHEIMADLIVVQDERMQADKRLQEVLAALKFGEEDVTE
jgi:type I restriction enzyme M protein